MCSAMTDIQCIRPPPLPDDWAEAPLVVVLFVGTDGAALDVALL